MHFYKPDSPWLSKRDADISSTSFPRRAVSPCDGGIPGGKGRWGAAGAVTLILQRFEAGDARLSRGEPVGSACKPPAFLAGKVRLYPRRQRRPAMGWGPGSDFGRANHSLGLLLGLLPVPGTAGITWATTGFGDSHGCPHSWGDASSHWCARTKFGKHRYLPGGEMRQLIY